MSIWNLQRYPDLARESRAASGLGLLGGKGDIEKPGLLKVAPNQLHANRQIAG
jgi:hypothetical protein